MIKVINEDVKTPKQKEALAYLKENNDTTLKDFPYSRGLLNKLVEQQAVQIIDKEIFRDPYSGKIEKETEFL